MAITAQVIEDSISPLGIRLTTFQLRYNRFVHSELMTHSLFNRNASSSRAIPVSRLIDDIERDPAEPLEWGRNQKGMQAHRELEGQARQEVIDLWREHRAVSIEIAREMADLNCAKQLVNRLIENHGHINVVVTATEYANFFYTRDHKDATPEIRQLAQVMRRARDLSQPKTVNEEEWHLPYVTPEERQSLTLTDQVLVSTARCARVSYLTHDMRSPALEDDLRLAHDLIQGDPKHASPAGHQATPADTRDFIKNFRGWIMHRSLIENEAVWDTHEPMEWSY